MNIRSGTGGSFDLDGSQLLEAIVEHLPAMVFVKEAEDLRFVLFNKEGEELLGIPRDELLGKTDHDLFPKEQADFFVAKDREVLAAELPVEILEEELLSPTRGLRVLHTRKVRITDARGRPRFLLGISQDITERRRSLDALRLSEARLRAIGEALPDVVLVLDEEARVVVVAGSGGSLTDDPASLRGRLIWDVFSQADVGELQAAIRATLDSRESQRIEYAIDVQQQQRWFEGMTAPLGAGLENERGVVFVARDITERVQLERQYLRAQKNEAIARLAGGVAHDFNNLLTVILTEIHLLQLARPTTCLEEHAGALAEICAAAQRGAALTRQLLTFSRQEVASPRVLDPVEVVQGLKRMVCRLIGEDIALRVTHDGDVGHVLIDAGQLEQVLVNLIVNARDAMRDGGHLQIELKNVVLDESDVAGEPDASTGPHVMIGVSDNGTGISEEACARLFEPFFTTKPSGRGTGLGLATSHGIVRQAGGHIEVCTEVGVGTTMKVYLPRTLEGTACTSEAPRRAQCEKELDATVLVVEDERAVRQTAVRALEGIGCTVHAAAGGAEALSIIERIGSDLDLIFTDVVMPDMTGPSMIERAIRLVPEVRVLYTTGYTADSAFRLQQHEGEVDVLDKPYTPADLHDRVRRALGL